jgi:hypothetical protein
MRKWFGASDGKPLAAREFGLPAAPILDRRFQIFVVRRLVGALCLREKFGE